MTPMDPREDEALKIAALLNTTPQTETWIALMNLLLLIDEWRRTGQLREHRPC